MYNLKPNGALEGRKQQETDGVQATPKTAELFEAEPAKWRLMRDLESHYRGSQRECFGSVTLDDINAIHRKLSWSCSRSGFESVNWINRSVQTLWPVAKTMVSKTLAENLKPEPPAPIRAKDIEKRQAKLSVYLSCRRQLNLIRRRRDKVLRKGDEYLSQKVIIVVIYLIKKLMLCAKQLLMDQIRGLISLLAADKQRSQMAADSPREKIELDIHELLRRQGILLRARQARKRPKAKSGPPLDLMKVQKIFRSRSSLSPESIGGSPYNSSRTFSSGLISLASLGKYRQQRKELARKLNKAHELKTEANKASGPNKIVLDQVSLGGRAPRITAVRYIDANESTSSLAKMMLNSPSLQASTSRIMQLLVEVEFVSDKNFCLRIESVPLLKRVELTRVGFRARLLVTANHELFADPRTNLDILDTPDTGTLLPILNYAQLSLVDLLQLDWSIRKPHKESTLATVRDPWATRRSKSRDRNTFIAILNYLKRNLQPINFINHSYFKYLVHLTLGLIQNWLKPFDILIGGRLRVRTLI